MASGNVELRDGFIKTTVAPGLSNIVIGKVIYKGS